MTETLAAHRVVVDDLERQFAHWLTAATPFADAEEFASAEAWRSVEAEAGLPLRRMLGRLVDELLRQAGLARGVIRSARSDPAYVPAAAAAVQQLRRSYTQVETTLEFFGDAVNTRTTAPLAMTLRTLDRLASASMRAVLAPAGLIVPPTLTYVDKGMGASILRAGIRLWSPGSVNPVAAIKIVRHNIYRPTSLFHETGHQVAAMTGWVPALRDALTQELADAPQLASVWSGWASEIAADVFAFAHTGYASVSALYDVVGDESTIFRWPLGDPHPIGWLRARLGVEMCRDAWGPGPWDALDAAVVVGHPISRVGGVLAEVLQGSAERMPRIARACRNTRIPGLAGRTIGEMLPPGRVSPSALADFEREAGRALWTSPEIRERDGIRIVALAGLREAERPQTAAEWASRARDWFHGTAVAA
ncbi:hypothetical protein [Microbacterium sp. Root180]|uniref:hypothetical protein n=1 Tax=Microbacterium sp. Root180 TaxID=1736483 RepID=UPI0006FD8CE5|nr:hypothetical protein [Microbacterium sp. Root180]KRB36150.1 hypothetical protein ASD93_08545 [Microbacterium sp. Root180]